MDYKINERVVSKYEYPLEYFMVPYDKQACDFYIREFEILKLKIETKTKLKLEQKYIRAEIKYHPYGILKQKIKKEYNGELVSNSWMKMYEFLSDFFVTASKEIVYFANAELPGGFISATNHYLSTREINLKWYANSLKTMDEYSPDLEIIQKYKRNWLMEMDENYNGDTVGVKNTEYIINKINALTQGVDLYTSDMSLHYSSRTIKNNPEDNIINVNLSILSQIFIGVKVLNNDGMMMIRIDVPFNSFIISVIILLMYAFECYIYKPFSSKVTSDEVFLVCKSYKKNTNLIEFLYNKLTNFDNNSLIPQYLLPSSVYMLVYSIMENKTSIQLYHLNILNELILSDYTRKFDSKINKKINEYFEKLKVYYLDNSMRLLHE